MHHKIFLKKRVQNLVAHVFTLLLAPFASKIVNYSKQSEKCMKKVKSLFSKENDVDFEFFREFKVSLCYASTDLSISSVHTHGME